MDKILYLFSDMENNPLYVGYGGLDRPPRWFHTARCQGSNRPIGRGGPCQDNSRFGTWMLEHDFAAQWRVLMGGLSISEAREHEGYVIRELGTLETGGPLLNLQLGSGPTRPRPIARGTKGYIADPRVRQAGFTDHQRVSISKKFR